MTFGEAVKQLHSGSNVARVGWNGKGMYLKLITNWESRELGNDYSVSPFIVMKTAQNSFVPWLASQTYVLATDFVVVVS